MRLLVTMIAAVLAAYAPAAFSAPPLTLEDMLALKRVTAAEMSPAGDRIAYLRQVPRTLYEDEDGPPYHELHVADLAGNSTPYVIGEVDVTDFAWAADGASIFFLASREPEAEFNSLYRIPLAGGEARELFTHVNAIATIHPSPDGETIAFVAADAPPASRTELEQKGFRAIVYEESVQPNRVWMLDLETLGATTYELPGSASDFAWSADGTRYAVALAPSPLIDDSYTSRDIHIVDAARGEVIGLAGSTGKLGHFAFSPDGDHLAYIGSVDINDPREGRLYVTDADGGGARRELVPEYDGHVSDFVWRDDASIDWLGGRGVWTEWQTVAIERPGTAGPAPDSGPILRGVHGHPGQDVRAAVADTPNHPPELFLLREGEEPVRLTDSNPWLAARELMRQEAITYQARDGLEVQAIVIYPANREQGGNPLVVIAHGGPESHYSNGWLTYYSRPGQVFAGDGYAVVYPNYRGSTGRGVAFSKLGQSDYADEEFNDLVDAKRHLVETGLVNGDRVGITGGSYGGYASMWSASALSDEYAAAVASVGISNQLSKFGTSDIPVEMRLVHSLKWPWDDWMWMLERSPVFHADKTETPLLIMHGDKDPRVHPSQSLEMYRAVKLRTDTPVRLVWYPDEGHGNRNTAAQYDFALRLKRWMDHYLKGPGGEPPPYEIDHAARLGAAEGAD